MTRENDIAACVRSTMARYFEDLDGQKSHAIYDMVLQCVEKPLLETVLQHASGNQTKAAELLGLNRNTLRKKMKQYGLR
ncbi:MAG: DNA-binding transcriptional regulator Fis [Burkholderiales bacterium]